MNNHQEAIRAKLPYEWQFDLNDSGTDFAAIAYVDCFTLAIQQSSLGAIGWISVDGRVGGGISIWRSRNEQGVLLDEVLRGMHDRLRQVRVALIPTQLGQIQD
jgi:hypothetical protein